MKKLSLEKQLKSEIDTTTPSVLDKVRNDAQAQGLLKDILCADIEKNNQPRQTKRRRNLFISITSSIVAVVICLAITLPLTLDSHNRPTWETLTIKDFSQYTAIAAGTYDAVNNTEPQIVAYATLHANKGARPLADKDLTESEGKQFNCLLGVDTNGTIRPIEFEENDAFLNTFGIVKMISYGRFTFIAYQRNYFGKIYADISSYNNDNLSLVLDNVTGKAYNFAEYASNSLIGFSDDAFFLRVYSSNMCRFYKFSLVYNKLEVREILNGEAGGIVYKSFAPGFRVDKYGNLYSYWGNNTQYIFTTQGQLVQSPEHVQIAANGIAYCGNKCYGQKGELLETDFVPDNFLNLFNNNTALLYHDMYRYTENNVHYFYFDRHNSYIDNYTLESSQIVKYEFLDETRYNIEIYELTNDEFFSQQRHGSELSTDKNFVGVNERLYFLNSNEIYYFDLKTQTYHTLTSNYLFEEIYTDEVGIIKFSGIDSSLNKVNGIINADDTVTIDVDVQHKNYKIYYLMPLN